MKFQTQYYGNYLVVTKDQIEIHFVECIDKRNFTPAGCYIFDKNVEDLFARFCSLDMIRPAGNLKNNARGKKEFSIIDNNGNELRFCEM